MIARKSCVCRRTREGWWVKFAISRHERELSVPGRATIAHLCARGAGRMRWDAVERKSGHTFAPMPTSSPDKTRGSGVESRIVGLIPSITPTAKPPETKPSTDRASSRFPRAVPLMKPEIPKVLLLRERSACTGRARPTPPRKDWRGVPGSGIERVRMYASQRRRKRGKKERTCTRERRYLY